MIGFEIAHLNVDQALERIRALEETAVFPVDEEGKVATDDATSHASAREIRLVLQRLLEIDQKVFFSQMRRLFFHLYAADHDHYQDLLKHAVQRNPEATQAFAIEMLLSEDVLFIDDQYTLHHLLDVLEKMGAQELPAASLQALNGLLSRPFFRLPSLLARLIRFLAPVADEKMVMQVRQLFEMDWLPDDELTWAQYLGLLQKYKVPLASAQAPKANPPAFERHVQLKDFENLRWMVGLEAPSVSLRFRLLGALVAGGPLAGQLFFEASESQPETAFHHDQFETEGHFHLFLASLDRLRETVVSGAHQSGTWFTDPSPDRAWPWMLEKPDAWPRNYRELPMYWGEFANPTDESEFGLLFKSQIDSMDQVIEKITLAMARAPLPSADQLQEVATLREIFLGLWSRLLPEILQRLDVIP